MKLSKECIGKKVINPQNKVYVIEHRLSTGDFAAVRVADQYPEILNNQYPHWEYYKEPEKLVKKVMYAPLRDISNCKDVFTFKYKKDHAFYTSKEAAFYHSNIVAEITVHIKEGE